MNRIATCDLKGLPVAALNKRRTKLLSNIVGRLRDLDPPVDAVVLPGGYFVLKGKQGDPSPYLKLDFERRCDLLRQAPFAKAATEAARTLDGRRKGASLIFGVDTEAPKDPSGDQLCVAWSAVGPVGVGRKVFPTEDEGSKGYVVNANDFGAKERVVRLGGTRVLLCSCYDGYGICNRPDKSKYIERMWTGDTRDREGRMFHRGEDPEFDWRLKRCLEKWRDLAASADAAAFTIHRFGLTGEGGFSTNYWRRHGIATASATLKGGWVAASANFEGRQPNPGKDILASHAVEEGFLSIKGNCRPTRDSEPVCDWVEGDDEVRMRVFDFRRPRGRKTRNLGH